MPNRSWLIARRAVLIVLCIATYGRSAHADVPGADRFTTLTYFPMRHGMQLVKVTVNHTKTVTFLFDSGTNYSVISDRLVSQLKLKPFPALTSLGKPMPPLEPGKPAQGVLLSSVTMGGLHILNSPFVVVNTDTVSAIAGVTVDGVIGANVAAKVPILLDFQKHQLTFFYHKTSPDDLRQIGMSDAVSVPVTDTSKSSVFKFPFTVKSGGVSVVGQMLLDTGANETHISGAVANQLYLTPQDHEPVSTYYGSVSTSNAIVSTLQVGDITFANLSVNYVDSPEIVSQMNGNILGLDVLSHFRVLLDYPDGKIYFQISSLESPPVTPPAAVQPKPSAAGSKT